MAAADRGNEDVAIDHEGHFPAGRGQGKLAEIRVAVRALAGEDGAGDMHVDSLGRVGAVAQAPDLAVLRKRDIAGPRHRQRAHRIAGEMRHLPGRAVVKRQAPDVQRAGFLAEIIDLAPRRPYSVAALVHAAGEALVHIAFGVVEPQRAALDVWCLRNCCSMLAEV